MKKFRIGPLYTPPSMEGTHRAARRVGRRQLGRRRVRSRNRDAVSEDRRLCGRCSASRSAIRRAPARPRRAEVDADYVEPRPVAACFNEALPFFKPPYAHLVAIDLNKGTIAWREPFGDMPALREELEKMGVTPPEKLGAQGPPGALVTKGGLIFVGGGDVAFHAIDKATRTRAVDRRRRSKRPARR